LIAIQNVTLDPNPVNVGGNFTVSAEVTYTKTVYKWGDLAGMTWDEISAMTWGDLFSYRNPDYRDGTRYCGTFNSGQDISL